MRDDRSDASPLDGAAGTVSQAAQTAGQIQKTVNQVRQGAGAAQKAAHTSQAAYAATASAQGGAAAAGATTGTALAGPLGTVVGMIVTSKTFWKVDVYKRQVADSGIGIPEEDQQHVFERFYRVDKSHSREMGGTGLGLAIARNAVILHRGSIKVHSNPGEGTTFTVRIPLNYVV